MCGLLRNAVQGLRNTITLSVILYMFRPTVRWPTLVIALKKLAMIPLFVRSESSISTHVPPDSHIVEETFN